MPPPQKEVGEAMDPTSSSISTNNIAAAGDKHGLIHTNSSLPTQNSGDNYDGGERGTEHRDELNHHHHGEGMQKPDTFEEILSHAILGAAKTYVMAHGARGGLNLFLIILQRRKFSITEALSKGLFGKDAFRFGIAFGGFSFLWKLVNNGLRRVRGKDDMLNGLIAGSVAGLSIMAEKRDRRITIAQQLFVRALHALHNAGHAREYFHFPHGDTLLFVLTSAQVLYAYTVRPKTIPPDFLHFMIKTARVSPVALKINEILHNTNLPIDKTEALNFVRSKGTKHALDYVSKMPPRPLALPCEIIHPQFDSCIYTDIERFYQVFKNILPVYASLNAISTLLFIKRLNKDPTGLIKKNIFNTIRSSAFLGAFVALYQTQICTHRNLLKYGIIKWDSKYFYWGAGLISGLSVLIEDKRRRTDLALYVLPKAAESWYKIMYQRNWIFELHKNADVWFFSAAMGIIMTFYQHEPEVLSPIVKTVLRKFVGKN